MAAPYRRTPVFDEATLPAGLRGEHRTRDGVWGVVRVLEGRLLLRLLDGGGEAVLTPDAPGLVRPGQPHAVAPLGRMRMRVEFHDAPPDGAWDGAVAGGAGRSGPGDRGPLPDAEGTAGGNG